MFFSAYQSAGSSSSLGPHRHHLLAFPSRWSGAISHSGRQLHVTASGCSWTTPARRRGIRASGTENRPWRRVHLAAHGQCAPGCTAGTPNLPYTHQEGDPIQRPSILCTQSSSFPWRLATRR
jgi:hypothetical protein